MEQTSFWLLETWKKMAANSQQVEKPSVLAGGRGRNKAAQGGDGLEWRHYMRSRGHTISQRQWDGRTTSITETPSGGGHCSQG